MYGEFKTRLDTFLHSYTPPFVFLKILFPVPKVSNSIQCQIILEKHFWKIHELETFDTRKMILKKIGGM